jgi:hypothetical protein
MARSKCRTTKHDLQPLRWILLIGKAKPIERAEVLHGDAKDFPTLLKKLQQSEAYKALQSSEEKTLEDRGITRPAPEFQAEER